MRNTTRVSGGELWPSKALVEFWLDLTDSGVSVVMVAVDSQPLGGYSDMAWAKEVAIERVRQLHRFAGSHRAA